MSLTELVYAMQRQAEENLRMEKELLQRIATLSSFEISEAASELYAPEKHTYSYDMYLYKLNELNKALEERVPPQAALELIENGLDMNTIITLKNIGRKGKYNE